MAESQSYGTTINPKVANQRGDTTVIPMASQNGGRLGSRNLGVEDTTDFTSKIQADYPTDSSPPLFTGKKLFATLGFRFVLIPLLSSAHPSPPLKGGAGTGGGPFGRPTSHLQDWPNPGFKKRGPRIYPFHSQVQNVHSLNLFKGNVSLSEIVRNGSMESQVLQTVSWNISGDIAGEI